MQELYTRIEDYLDNALTDAERATFEADARADPALAAALAEVREARERLARQWAQESAETELKETLKTLGKQHFGGEKARQPARRVSFGRWWMAAAAAAAALVVWFAWPPGTNALYGHYRQFPEASFTTRSVGEQNLGEAAKSFNNKDFAAALATLKTYLETSPADLEARLFTGLCQLELGQLTDAEATFSQLASTENAWSGEARWYLALTYLREGKTQECREVLGQIPPGGAHHAEAQELLRKM